MAAPFTITSVSNYNSNPPSDDGSQTASNRLQWSTQKSKLADPVFNAFNTSETNTSAAFGKVVGGAGITSTAISYTVTAADQSKLIKATAAGITITTPDATVVGAPFVFSVLNNSSGDITLAGNGVQTVDGSASFTIPANCGLMVNTDGSNWFTGGQNFNNVLTKPEGYLTLATGTPVLIADLTSSSVFYTLFEGDRVPISVDGATFKMRQFTELTLTLVSNHLADTIYDVFAFDNAGVTTIGTGPAWNNSTASTSARGTGAGTTEIQRLHGLWVNKNSMTARNGSTTYTVAANQGTYLGSIYIDHTAGQVTCHRSFGQNRKWGVWNAYNRVPIMLQAVDPTASWVFSGALRASNNTPASYTASQFNFGSGTAVNGGVIFCGLAEEEIDTRFEQTVTYTNNGSQLAARIGIATNGISVTSGKQGQGNFVAASGNFISDLVAKLILTPTLGLINFVAMESGGGTGGPTFSGQAAGMVLSASYRG